MDLGETWQRGCNAWGIRGFFPSSCVKELHLSGRSRQLSERSAQAQASELPPYALGQARALMSLHAQLNEELDFREGDLIIITGLPETGWFQGELEGRRGIFPEGFVELLGPLRSPQEPVDCEYLNNDSEQFSYEDPYDAGEGTEEESVEGGEIFVREEEEQKEAIVAEEEEEEEEEGRVYAVALYEFRAMEAGELDFDMGDRIRVINTLEDGWLEGELRGQRGIFPHRFVKIEGDDQKPADEPIAAEPEKDKEISCNSEYSSGDVCPNGSDNDSEWTTHEDHTVWDLDYFEKAEEQRLYSETKNTGPQTNNGEQRDRGSRPNSRPQRPVAPTQRGPERPKTTPPARPRLPSRPSPPAHSHRHSSPSSSTNRSKYTNGNSRSSHSRLSHSLTLPHTQSGWSKDSRHYQRSSTDAGTTINKSATLGHVLLNLAQSHKQKKLTHHASVSDDDMMMCSSTQRSQQTAHGSNGFLSTPLTLNALATSAGDLEAKLSQQLFEFEKSLTSSYSDTNMSSAAPRDMSSVGDLSQQSSVSRHFSILEYGNENDIIRGSLRASGSNLLRSNSTSSTLEKRRTLRPPPPRPRALRPPPPPAYRPTRPAPRPPPRCPRQNTAPPTTNSLADSPIFYTPDEPALNILDQVTDEQNDFGDLAAAQEREIQHQQEVEKELEREMELESQRQREEEERYQLLLRLQEVESDMEAYAHTAEELRTMLEEEEDETARMQAMENLEFCNYTLETLALEQQQLQGKTFCHLAVNWKYF